MSEPHMIGNWTCGVAAADAQALADVRTLDVYCRKLNAELGTARANDHIYHKVRPGRGTHDPAFICQAVRFSNGFVYADLGPGGETEEAARAKAAAWVREQKP